MTSNLAFLQQQQTSEKVYCYHFQSWRSKNLFAKMYRLLFAQQFVVQVFFKRGRRSSKKVLFQCKRSSHTKRANNRSAATAAPRLLLLRLLLPLTGKETSERSCERERESKKRSCLRERNGWFVGGEWARERERERETLLMRRPCC